MRLSELVSPMRAATVMGNPFIFVLKPSARISSHHRPVYNTSGFVVATTIEEDRCLIHYSPWVTYIDGKIESIPGLSTFAGMACIVATRVTDRSYHFALSPGEEFYLLVPNGG